MRATRILLPPELPDQERPPNQPYEAVSPSNADRSSEVIRLFDLAVARETTPRQAATTNQLVME
jgi:hypothetical protein